MPSDNVTKILIISYLFLENDAKWFTLQDWSEQFVPLRHQISSRDFDHFPA